MEIGTSPEGQELAQAPREIVTTVSVNGLEETENNPQIHGEKVQVTRDGCPHYWSSDNTKPQKHYFNWRGVFGGETKGC